MEKVIELINVTKIYKSRSTEYIALRDINLEIEKGEFVAIVGPSGSGKTTLLNIIGLLDSPTYGKVILEGKDVTMLNDNEKAKLRNKKIGFIFQTYNLISYLTVYENVELPLIISGVPEGERRKIVMNTLSKIPGLLDLKNKKPNQLSAGQQQRVAIARALVMNPSIILADEPTANLDTKNGQAIISLFREINDKMGVTIIMATHDPEMLKYCKRIIRIRDGVIEKEEKIIK
ncbi:MAG: ABC transporter ATP-binding protein [Sulfolobaceae archaeon]